jgi:CRISPR/Cas system CSM-associated protein Csm4 (group 5 of RAMP superfamily)
MKKIKTFNEEINKSLKGIQKNTIKQVKEVNKTVQDLKREIETIKKIQTERIMEMENLGKRRGTTDVSSTETGDRRENLRSRRIQ